jgi:hypothetical protein
MIFTIIVVYIIFIVLGLGLNIFFLPKKYSKYRYILAPWISTVLIIFIGISLSSSKIAMEHSLLSNVMLKGYQFICVFGLFILLSALLIKGKLIFTKKINFYYIVSLIILTFLYLQFEKIKIDRELIKWAEYYSKETIVGFLGKSQNPTLLNKNIGEPMLISFWKAILNNDYLQTISYIKVIYFSLLLGPLYILLDVQKNISHKIKIISIILVFTILFLFRDATFNLNIILSFGLLLCGICISIFLIREVKNYTINGLSALLGMILFALFTINPIAFVILTSFLLIIILANNSNEKKYLAFNYLMSLLIMSLMNPLVIGLTLFHP